MIEKDTPNNITPKSADSKPATLLLKNLLEERSLVCSDCHSILNWIEDSIRRTEYKKILKGKRRFVDLFNKYKDNDLNNIAAPDKFVKDVAKNLSERCNLIPIHGTLTIYVILGQVLTSRCGLLKNIRYFVF